MKTKLNILIILAFLAAPLGAAAIPQDVALALPPYAAQGSVNLAPASPTLTAVDPLAYIEGTDVIPARPFLYSVDANGLTITRFNDNAVVGAWPWPEELWITLPDGGKMAIPEPAGGWEPVAMTVSAPTGLEYGNRVKDIPDLTPPFTFVYVVMARSGYEWVSTPDPTRLETANVRDHLVPSTNPDNESSVLVQFNVNDPSFSASRDPAAPTEPHIAGALLGHNAGQPAYDPKTGNVYVGNLPSGSLPAGLTSFVSVISRISDSVAAEEREIPGIEKPVIRCGPQHPEVGIPVGRPQAYACYDPSALHPINDNEHVGGYGVIEQWDTTNTDLLQEQYVWEFRNLPDWLTPHVDLVSGEPDGILYGTPPATGEWFAEARVHNLDDEYGVFSDWHPIRLLVTPTAEYLPVKAQFAAGVPVSWPLEGTGTCEVVGAPAWVDVKAVPNGCVVMGRAPISGEHYNFTMPGFRETAYPDIPLVFNGDVVGGYGFDPLPEGVGLSGLAWHQVEKYADPSTETPVMTGEYIGVEPSTGQLWQILQPAGQPQPPNERPAETAIKIDTVTAEGAPLAGSGFGPVAVEADRDIYVAADGGVFKISGGVVSTIATGFRPSSLSLDSDLRPAIVGVEPGQEDHGALWAAGADNVAVIDTDLASVQSFPVPGASSVTVDFGPRWAYAAAGSGNLAIFGPEGTVRPPMMPRIWSSEELNFNRGYPGEFRLMATGDPLPTLDLFGELPDGLTYVDIGDGFPWVSGTPADTEGGDGYAYNVTATNAVGGYAQAFGITVYGPAEFTTEPTATFTAGSASSFTVAATAPTAPIMYTWAEEPVMAPGVQLVDHEDGTAGLQGIPTVPGTYNITIGANTGFLTDEFDTTQLFMLIVKPEGTLLPPTITSANTALWEAIGAPYAPDQVTITSIGSPTPALSIVTKEGQTGLPPGVNFIDNGDSTGALGSGCAITWPGMAPECLALLPEGTLPGTYSFTIRAENSNGVVEQEFTLDLEVATSIMTSPPEAPANLSFAYTPGGPTAPQTFSVGTLGDTLPYAAVTTQRWLKVAPVSGTIPSDLSVSLDPTELAKLIPGTYTGSVLVTSAATEGPFAVALVTLTVMDTSAPGELGIFPGTLNFAYQVNSFQPPAQPVLVMSGGVPLDYTVSTGGARWLSALAGGTAPGVFSVSVDTHVGVGMHIANLTVTSGEQTQIIPVTLVKTAGDADLIQVMFDVGSGPEGLAANLITHNLFITSSNAAAEAAEAGGASAAAVELPGPPEPPLVFHIDPVNKKLLKEIVVHGEAEYIGVNSTTGIAYQASQATGEIAVIDGSTNSVLAYIDLTLNGDPQTPYQVAIDEAQNIIYVGAKSPEPEPNALIGPPYGCKAIRELPSDEAPAGQEEFDCWHPGPVIVIDGDTNQVVSYFMAGDDPEGVVFAAATGKVYASNEDDGNVTVAQSAVRNADGSITPPEVLGTIIKGSLVAGLWEPTCDENNDCGAKEVLQRWLWPDPSACHGIDDEAEEADKMAVDPAGNVYIIDDRYRVAKINGQTDKVVEVLEIPGYDCERTVPDDSPVVLRNTANNIAYMALGQGKLYVTSEQNTATLIQWSMKGKKTITTLTTLTLPEAAELDAITTDRTLNQVYITDEGLASLWILKGACANGEGVHCVP